jgi:uncharacterized DUF497 family protein
MSGLHERHLQHHDRIQLFLRIDPEVSSRGFEWDEEKRRVNIRKHGFDFTDAVELFSGAMLVYPDTRHDYEETRWSGLQWIRGSLIQIVFTEKESDRAENVKG